MESVKLKYIAMDVDGTLTDGKIYMGQSGEVFKAFDIKDGCGIGIILPKAGITPIIITARESQIVLNRAQELNITHVYQSCRDKLSKLKEITNNDLETVAYIGDDIPDLECMKEVKNAGGFVGCPADAVEEVKSLSDFISTKPGGNGAVREFIEWIVKDSEEEARHMQRMDESEFLKIKPVCNPNECDHSEMVRICDDGTGCNTDYGCVKCKLRHTAYEAFRK